MRKKYEEPEMNTGNGTVNHYNVIAKLYRYGTLKVMVIFIKVVLFSGDLEAKSREKEAQYESRLEALRRDLAEVREQLSSETEAGQQDKENIRLLKEAKSCLEQDKMRLEADVMEREAKVEEVERTVAEGAKRIADLGIKTHFEV